MRGSPNAIVYIDDLLIHSKNHEDHLVYLEKVLQRLEENHMKLNIEKFFFLNTEVSYLDFVLTPERIKPSRDKLRSIKVAQPPTDMKADRSFIGLCNFFRTHIKNFATVSAPHTKLTRKDSGYNGGPLTTEALNAFLELKKRLMTDPVVNTLEVTEKMCLSLMHPQEQTKLWVDLEQF